MLRVTNDWCAVVADACALHQEHLSRLRASRVDAMPHDTVVLTAQCAAVYGQVTGRAVKDQTRAIRHLVAALAAAPRRAADRVCSA